MSRVPCTHSYLIYPTLIERIKVCINSFNLKLNTRSNQIKSVKMKWMNGL